MDFNYCMPTKVYFQNGAINANKEALLELGTKPLIVTGKISSKINGSLQDMTNALKYLKMDYVIFDDVEENPSLETIELAAKLGKEHNVDFVIGIGGGSPLDASKAIAVLIKNPELDKQSIFTSKKLKYLPLVAVPTTSGTGSEVTPYSIITVHSEKTKKNLGQSLFPSLAFVDSTYTKSIPYEITVNTSIDAFTHLVESYMSTSANTISDIHAEEGFRLFKFCFKKLLKKDLNAKFREKVMTASLLGGFAIAQTSTSLPHGMGYPLTYFKNLPHGLANGVLTVEYLKSFKNKAKIEKMLKLLDLKDCDELKLIFSKLFDVKLEISEDEILQFSSTFISNKNKLKNHPEEIDLDILKKIYMKSLK